VRRLTAILCALCAAVAIFGGEPRAEDRIAAAPVSASDAAPAKPSGPSRITVLPPPGAKEPSREIKVLPAADCRAGQQEQGGRCVAIPAPAKPQLKNKPQLKKETARPEPTARERAEKPRERIRQRVREENFSRRPVVSRAACPAGSSPMSQGGRTCCETTPERGAPRIFCL
jgi:hypothetical protein